MKDAIGYEGKVINDLSKKDGAPVKVLGKKLFSQYFNNFIFTDYEEGIRQTVDYYKGQKLS